MRNFAYNNLLISLLILLPVFPVLSQSQDLKMKSLPWIQPLGSGFEKALFKGSLDISKHHLTGLLFFKQTSDTSFRIIFNNEIGMKYFDLEFVGENFIIHYCFPSLSRKSLLRILESDFRMLLSGNLSPIIKISIEEQNPETIVYKVVSTSGKFLFTIDEKTKRITEIRSSGKFLRKMKVAFYTTEKQIPGKIRIQNPTIRLSLTLTLLDR